MLVRDIVGGKLIVLQFGFLFFFVACSIGLNRVDCIKNSSKYFLGCQKVLCNLCWHAKMQSQMDFSGFYASVLYVIQI